MSTGLIRVFNDIENTSFGQAINYIVLFLQLRKDPTVGTKFTRTHFPTITIHISLNMFHWRLETK